MEKVLYPQNLKPTIAFYENIVYTSHIADFFRDNINLKLNLLLPVAPDNTFVKSPVLVWLEGGAWRNSTPYYRTGELADFVKRGYAVASVDYSVDANNIWPACIKDVKTAIRYLRAHKDQFNLDTDNIVVAGESAGAHLAALVGLTPDKEEFKTEEYKEFSDKVNGAILWYCPGDMSAPVNDYFNYVDLLIRGDSSKNPNLVAELNPMTYADKKACPFLFFHGNKDMLVPIENSKLLYEKLIKAGTDADYYTVDGVGHADIAFTQDNIHELMDEFMKKVNKKL